MGMCMWLTYPESDKTETEPQESINMVDKRVFILPISLNMIPPSKATKRSNGSSLADNAATPRVLLGGEDRLAILLSDRSVTKDQLDLIEIASKVSLACPRERWNKVNFSRL